MSLSGEVRIRLDVTRGIEGARARDDPMRDRMSPEQRERIRELFATDMNVRAEASRVPADEEPLRGLPSYQVELGPDGRAYAVEPGVEFDVEPATDRQRCAEAYRAAAELPGEPEDYGTVTRRHFTRV